MYFVSYNENVVLNKADRKLNYGIDANFNITSSLKLNTTINPDFSQVEIDDQITNLTRFNISFLERRSGSIKSS
ncbi:DUF5916 domain-containing protein [Gaetbulibacter sp. M235]|uniref:DUF5916 domain-containing protein n=1 Tax=Gaetbulibacter sp. M235 TaxID=3126510 RepID=UPI00374F32D8